MPRIVTRKTLQQIARDTARKMLSKKAGRQARIIALSGELGSGKTTFAQAFIASLGIRGKVISPTFLIDRVYELPARIRQFGYRQVHHVDLYRITSSRELSGTGVIEACKEPSNIMLIEWPERIDSLLPRSVVRVSLSHTAESDERVVAMSS